MNVRGLAGVLVSCLGLLRRLMSDARVARRHKIALAGALGYLALPFDIVPDFLPVVGYLDDALVVALALRLVVNGAGPGVVIELWSGSDRVLGALLRLAGTPLWPPSRVLARIAGVGALGLGVCIWVDLADNCAGGLTCREQDPLLLSAGRGIAVALVAAGVVGLAARVLGRRGSVGP
jgi:uncharacterized membrane protein YkvA (DUF1232 family)